MILKWKSKNDLVTCERCRRLHGYTWTVKSSESFPERLEHPDFGVVAYPDRNVGCLNEKCRCDFSADADWTDTIKLAKEVLADLKMKEKKLKEIKRQNKLDRMLNEWDDEDDY